MKKQINKILLVIFTVFMILKIVNVIVDTDSLVLSIFERWSLVWLKVAGIGALSAFIIFKINHANKDESKMSRLGMCIFPFLLPLLTYLAFGDNLWLLISAGVVGLIVGYFTYIIDDHLIDLWDARLVSLPFVIGIVLAATTAISIIKDHWKNENIYVANKATCAQVIVERYTAHTGKKSTTYSWDYHTSYEYTRLGSQYYQPREDVDYTLGYGALFNKDRVKHKYFTWIGGYKSSDDPTFSWILLNNDNLHYDLNKSYKVEENYFGTALSDGKENDRIIPTTINQNPELPENIPSGSSLWQSFKDFFSFFKLLFTEDGFVLLKWVYIGIFGLFIVLAILYKECRLSLYTFLISFSVVLLIIFALFASRAGVKISDLLEDYSSRRKRFGGFGGGSFGGGGGSGRW